jgi:hypothetical protein
LVPAQRRMGYGKGGWWPDLERPHTSRPAADATTV